EVTASVNGGKATETRKRGTNGRVFANANAGCPAGEKNCKMPGKTTTGVSGKTANGPNAMSKEKTATAGKTTGGGGTMTGSIGKKPGPKKCQPGTAVRLPPTKHPA